MKINLNLLPWNINDYVEIPKSFYENTDIINLDKVKVDGTIKYNLSDEIEIILELSGVMYLLDAITCEEIKYPFNVKIDEILDDNSEDYAKYYEKSKNILDIIEFLWENIVLEVPIRLTNASGAKLEGNGWKLNNSEEDDEIDPRMEKLNELFKGGE